MVDENTLSAMNGFTKDIIKILKINLTKDTYEIIKSDKSELVVEKGFSKSIFGWIISFAESGQVHPADIDSYRTYANKSYLINYFTKKDDIWRLRYRRKKDDDYLWVMMEMRPTENFAEDNQELYLYVQNIDNELVDYEIEKANYKRVLKEEQLIRRVTNEVLNIGTWRMYFDNNGNEVESYYDSKYRKMLGYSEEDDILSKKGEWLGFLHEDDVEDMLKEFQELINSAGSNMKNCDQEFRMKTKDEGYKWFRSVGELYMVSEGVPYMMIGIIMDISKRKQSQRTLQIIKALSLEYQNAYWGDLDSGEVFNYHMDERITNPLESSVVLGDYEDIIRLYSENFVYVEDRYLFEKISNTKLLDEMFGEKERFRFNYRIDINGEISYYLCQCIRVDKNSREFILGLKNINESVKKEYEQQEMLKKALLRAEEALIKEREKQEVINSLAGIYYTMHLIDLKENTCSELNANEVIHDIGEEYKHLELQESLNSVFSEVVSENDLESVLEFINMSTVAQRLVGRKIISHEFCGKFSGWVRISFIIINVYDNGTPHRIIMTTRIIDDDKKKLEHLIKISRTDELTRLYNRRAFEEDIDEFEKNGISDDLRYIAMDLDGLKVVNDSLGHLAGDEIIIGAAECMSDAFNAWGKVYRTGGDEFVAIIYCKDIELPDILADLEENIKNWSGKFVNSLSISKGVVSFNEFKEYSINDLEKLADKRMYDEKQKYYFEHNIERRRR